LKNTSNIRYFGITDVGKKRDHNEDYIVLPESSEISRFSIIKRFMKGNLFILCDGVGGANSGEVASKMTSTNISRMFYDSIINSENPIKKLLKIITIVNKEVYDLASHSKELSGMGTTLVLTLIHRQIAYIISIGDSRAYLLRDHKFSQITSDHSEVWELYSQGIINKEEMRNHPRSNIITMAVGMDEDLPEGKINCNHLLVKKGDTFLLCSDGLTDMVKESDIERILDKDNDVDEAVNNLISLANDNGGKDNISVIIIKA